MSDRSLKISFFFSLKGALLKSSDLSSFDHVSSRNGCFTFQIWHEDFSFRKCIRFPDFSPDFSGFSSNLQISSQNRWITSHIWYNYLFWKFIRVFLSTRIFPDFHQFFRFLHRMYDLLLTYDMMISFSGNFSRFFLIFIKSLGLLLTYGMKILFFGNLVSFQNFFQMFKCILYSAHEVGL